MAYPNFYPQFYQPLYPQPQQPIYQPQPQPQNLSNNTATTPQIQNGGLVSVHNENEAKNYPVSLGTSVMFKDESEPNVIYTKTMGFNQLDAPTFTRYRLVKEDAPTSTLKDDTEPKTEKVDNSMIDDLKADMGVMREDIDSMWKEIELLKKKPTTRKKEDEA